MSPRATCPHGHLDTCTPCLAEAHERAIQVARTVLGVVTSEALKVAEQRIDDAIVTKCGFNFLRAHGIAVMCVPLASADAVTCRRCGWCSPSRREQPCGNLRCPGRRLRFQPPEVRGR